APPFATMSPSSPAPPSLDPAPPSESHTLSLHDALPIFNYYTSTEAAPAQSSMVFDPRRPAALGKAVAGGVVRVCDEAGRPCPTRSEETRLNSSHVKTSYAVFCSK